MAEKITNLHPKDDSSTTIYPNTKSECIIDKDISSYVSGHVPDSALVQKSMDSMYTKLDTKIDDTKVELTKEINEVDSTLIDEINERETSDNLIRKDMETADKDIQSKITSLTTELSNETAERKNAISSIQEDLTTLDNSLLSTNGRVNTLENEMVNAQEDISSNKTNIETILSSYIDKSSAQTITGSKIFKQPIKTNEIDNENGNSMLRYKETEGKNVVGGSNYPLTLMGSEDRPTYSKNGSDFNGNALALKSDVDTNWNLLMANLGVGRWANQTFVRDWWGADNIFYDSMLPFYTNVTRTFANIKGFDFDSSKPVYVSHDFNASINEMRYTFAWSELNKELLLPSVSQAIRMHYTFYGSAFTKIGFKDGVEPWKLKGVISWAFAFMPNLTEIGAFDVGSVQQFDKIFSDSKNIKSIHCTHFKISFDISPSTAFEEADLVEIISNLDTVIATQTLTMGSTNLAKLTDEEKKVATDKGWTLA